MTTSPKCVPIPKNGVDYRGKVVLAPMVRSGELPMRLLALKYGADLVWGPETVDRALIGTTRHVNSEAGTVEFRRQSNRPSLSAAGDAIESVIFRLHPEKERGKLIYQVGTASPDLAVKAAKLVAGDVAGIDVNAGCPKPFSTEGGMGAALLRTPDLLTAILEALVKEVGTPHEIGISVKIRLLDEPEDTAALVKRLVKTGITGLTVHCRTRAMRPTQRAIRDQLRMIGDICHEAGVACLMNGDVISRGEAVILAEEYGVDGAMIATAAEKNPSVFRSMDEGGPLPWPEIAREYARTAVAVQNRWGNCKFSLTQLIPGKTDEGRKLSTTKTYRGMVEILGLSELEAAADGLDFKFGLQARIAKPQNQPKPKRGSPLKVRNRHHPAAIARGAHPPAMRTNPLKRSQSAGREQPYQPFEREEPHPPFERERERVRSPMGGKFARQFAKQMPTQWTHVDDDKAGLWKASPADARKASNAKQSAKESQPKGSVTSWRPAEATETKTEPAAAA